MRKAFFHISLIAALSVSVVAGCKKKGGGGSTPTPTPSPASSPTPTGTPRPDLTASCARLANGTGGTCSSPGARAFESDVRWAIEQAKINRPDNYRPQFNNVGDPELFLKDVAAALDTKNICGVPTGYGSGQSRFFVRNANNANENYSIFEYNGTISGGLTPEGCSPAQPFPPKYTKDKPADPYLDPHDPFCTLPPSGENQGQTVDCPNPTAPQGQYAPDVYGAIDELINEERASSRGILDIDGGTLNTDHDYKILDTRRYITTIIDKVRAKGYCAVTTGSFDGIPLKKNTNSFSEYYDLNNGSSGVRIRKKYIATCTPAEL